MIQATKANVDEARTELADHLEGLAFAISSWQHDPTNEKRLRDARTAFDAARLTFDTYDEVLRNWAAGPTGDDRG